MNKQGKQGEYQVKQLREQTIPTRRQKQIYVVDEHPLVRDAIMHVIQTDPELTVCGWSASSKQAINWLQTQVPDLVVIEISVGDWSGLELMKWIRSKHPRLPIMALSMHDEIFYAERVLRAGGKGYVMKHAETAQILKAIRTVVLGIPFFSPEASAAMKNQKAGPLLNGGVTNLSSRELQVFQMIGKGIKTGEIANKLNLSIKTVETFRGNIKKKLQLKTGSDLARKAYQWVDKNIK